jgi:putative MFS transporter
MLRALDEAPITRRYVILAVSVMVGAVLDLFDFFLIAFVVPILADEWDLSFGEATVVLLSAGLGAIAGSILWGRLGDRYGRRRPLIAGILTFSLATGAAALAPDDGWWFVSIFRFIVGAGVAGVAVIAVPMVLEFTPTRLRTKVTGGILAAALATAALDPNWRPLFAIGLLPILLVAFVVVYVPESPRWLLDQGRTEEARRVIAFLLMRDENELALESPPPPADQGSGFADLLRYRQSVRVTALSWFGASAAVAGVILWGPTFLEEILELDSDEAALLFGFVTLGSFGGRLCFSFLPQRTGRRLCGILMGLGAAPLLVLAALSGETEVAGASLFLVALVAASFFVDGGFANLAPYTSEVFPTRMRTHGMGLAWVFSGVGRIVGPLGVGLIAGTGDLIEPQATLDALTPAFLYLAAFALLVGIAFLSTSLEPHGRDLETLSAELLAEATPAGPAPVETAHRAETRR